MGRVAGAGGEIQKPRVLGIGRTQVAQVADRAVGQVLAQVVAVCGRSRGDDRMVVLEQRWDELVGLAAVEPVPALKSPLARP